jgi:predicted DNA-binding protein (UPF0251 family)
MVAARTAPPAARPEVSLETVDEKLDAIMRRLDAMKLPDHPGLTGPQFAKAAGISRTTVGRRLADGTIVRKNGRIPHSELRKFLS